MVGGRWSIDSPLFNCPLSLAPLQFFIGKGGVGKSTLASLNGRALAVNQGPVLLVSLDPAHSLGDIWATPIGDTAVEVAPGLWAREVDGPARWGHLRGRWQELLEAAADRNSDIPGWHEMVDDLRRVLDLMPPGVDEIIGLFFLMEALEGGAYRTVVVDCAPTGHFLRLLALPELVLEWVRMLMRLVLKYREVIELGSLAEELIAMSRGLKTIGATMRNAERCAFLPITLPQAMSVAETRRLIAALEEAGTPIACIVLNRVPRHAETGGAVGGIAEELRASYPYPVVEVALAPSARHKVGDNVQ